MNEATAPRNVLLVDDNPDVFMLVRTRLRKSGRTDLVLHAAKDGHEALGVVKALGSNLALVLSDVRMPRLDGHQLLQAAREAGYGGPFVLIGSLVIGPHAADEWIDKDTFIDRLPEVLARVLPTSM